MEIITDAPQGRPRVAVMPSPGLGHVTPLLELAKRLVTQHGFAVTFLVIATTEPTPAQDKLLNSPTLPSDLDVLYLPPVDPSSITTPDTLLLTRLCLIVQESIKCLKSTLMDLKLLKALVVDILCAQANDICKELDIPSYTFFTTSATMLAFLLYLPTLEWEVDSDIEFTELDRPIEVPGCGSILPKDLLDQAKNRKTEDYSWLLYQMGGLKMAVGILLNTWEALEPAQIRALRENPFYLELPVPEIFTIGPVIKDDEPEVLSQSDVECLEWLDQQLVQSVLLISMGSGGTLTEKQITEIAWGLELSQQRFIWVVRRPTNASRSGTFFTAGNKDEDDPQTFRPEGFLDRTRGVGMVVPSWIAQVAVLGHRSTGAFLSHCGWNSSIESITKGVPMIAWPLYAEQRTNATMLVEELQVAIKVGEATEDEVIGREEIARVIRIVMEGEEGKVVRAKVEELKNGADKASELGGSSFAALSRACMSWKNIAQKYQNKIKFHRLKFIMYYIINFTYMFILFYHK